MRYPLQLPPSGSRATSPIFPPRSMKQAHRSDSIRTALRAPDRAGVSAIVVGETAGEASTLTPAEQEPIVRAAVEIARGRVRVIAGAGSNSTSQAIELTRRAEAAGADAVLSVVPYYNKPMQAGIEAHFRAIAGSTATPHHPARHSLAHHPRIVRRHAGAARRIQAVHRIAGWHRRCDAPARLRSLLPADSGCCPETTPPRWPLSPSAGMAASRRYRMSRRICARPSFRAAGRDGCSPRDTCRIGWRR